MEALLAEEIKEAEARYNSALEQVNTNITPVTERRGVGPACSLFVFYGETMDRGRLGTLRTFSSSPKC